MRSLMEMYENLLKAIDEAPQEERDEFVRKIGIGFWRTFNSSVHEAAMSINPEIWEVKDGGACFECGSDSPRLYRLKRTKNYNKTKAVPEHRCEACSIRKYEDLKKRGRV